MGDTYMPGSKALEKWLKQKGLSSHAFGLSLRLDPGIIRSLISGRRVKVDVKLADAIERATDGAITWQMWIPVQKAG